MGAWVGGWLPFVGGVLLNSLGFALLGYWIGRKRERAQIVSLLRRVAKHDQGNWRGLQALTLLLALWRKERGERL